MKNNNYFLKGIAFASLLGLGINQSFAQEETRLGKVKVVSYHKETKLPNFIRFTETQSIAPDKFVEWATYAFNLPSTSTLKAYSVENDKLGFTHTRYKQYANGYPVEGTMLITHTLNGKLKTVNGEYFQNLSSSFSASLSEADALQFALKKINAKVYKWENKEIEAQKRKTLNDPNFTYYPKGELVVVHKRGVDYSASNIRLAYKFNVYAEVPLYRANVFVDAQTGEVISEEKLIHTADVVGSAVTMFSGTVTMTSDNTGTNAYRLRETGRGLGINTYNMNNSMNYTQTDFTNLSSTWNLAGTDQAAADAHWGAEKTYDYYSTVHSRNSIDGNGYALNSYMHYSTNYVNAFWDGTEMTYGDGDVSQGFLMMTALDVCGHEITHGLTSNTAGLNGGGNGEPDALNEGFSDIFGTTIEAFARPNQHDWIMGADITCNSSGVQNFAGIRDMSNPKNQGQPNCYMGTNWDSNGEPHNNNGPSIYWYYLLCQGGSGTNDIGNTWNVNGITMAEAQMIAFRGLTFYFTPGTTYADARTFTMEAATDLYGICSQELASTTNAWYAVGVGAAATGSGVPTAAFSVNNSMSCSAPLSVQFANTTTGATSYNWSFGDGATSTTTAPAHTYTAAGTYAVQLIATGTCSASSKDTLTKTSYITVNGPPSVTSSTAACGPQSFVLTANGVGTITWSNAGGTVGTGSTYTTPTLSASTTYSATSSIMTTGTSTVLGAPALNTTLGAGAYLNYSHYLIFDASAGFILHSVDVYAQTTTSSQPTIQLLDNTGAVLQSISPTTSSAGVNTVTLDWHIPIGTGYRLVATGTNINLYRNSAGASFPIAVGAVASITGTDVTSTNPNYYYWFYNWKVVPDAPCYSAAGVITTNVTSCSGIAINNAQSTTILVYPNPAHNSISVTVLESTNSISVTDIIGQTVIAEQKVNGAQQVQTIDIANLASGVYFMKINSTDNQTKIIRFIKE